MSVYTKTINHSSLYWPSRDGSINLLHNSNCFIECYHYALIMADILTAQNPPFAILPPLLTHLISSDLIIPYLLWYFTEILIGIDQHISYTLFDRRWVHYKHYLFYLI